MAHTYATTMENIIFQIRESIFKSKKIRFTKYTLQFSALGKFLWKNLCLQYIICKNSVMCCDKAEIAQVKKIEERREKKRKAGKN